MTQDNIRNYIKARITEEGYANTTALIYAHQIAVARATASEVREGVFANRK